MQQSEYCAYPPKLAPDLELSQRTDSASPSYIAGSASAGRYLILGPAEHRVLELVDGDRTPAAICSELEQRTGSALKLAVLTGFMTKLDEVGILAGERTGRASQGLTPASQIYIRWSLFNPDRLFGRLLPTLRWIWTRWFFAASMMLMGTAALLVLTNWPEVSRYSGAALTGHYLTIFVVAWMVTITHEFAHGMTSKAFGGRATEVGVLLVYYCLPALYCNVSGLHLIPARGQRLWVIAAGIYWQCLVAACALLAWMLLNPDTLPGLLAMTVVLGCVLDLVFNTNPLIKLDGYYFLSQWLRIPNLMDRSRACWRALLGRVLAGKPDAEARKFTRRDYSILLVFGLFSFSYNLALPAAILWYASGYLMDWFGFPGLLLSAVLGLAWSWRPLKKMLAPRRPVEKKEEVMASNESTRKWRRFVPAAIPLALVAVLCIPWRASVGSYGELVAILGREAIVRAPQNASLLALAIQPGQQVARGASIGRMGNLDLDEQIAQVRTELTRVGADAERLTGELRVQRENATTSEWQLAQRRSELNDVEGEEQQIRARLNAFPQTGILLASSPARAPEFPAALAAMEADARQLSAKLAEANRQLERARSLFADKILARSELDAAEARSSTVAFDLAAARERLNAALIEHRRRYASKDTDVNLARTSLSAGRAQAASLGLQLDAAGKLQASLEARLSVLEQKRAQFDLAAPVTGTLFGDDLPRMLGQYFKKGSEICRIADTREMLVRARVPEQALGDIALGEDVRVKTRAFPNREFSGVVSKIGDQSELDANGQRSYRVELTIQNQNALLRPGMTVFARAYFGRHTLAWLAMHKLKQSLRPEMWML